MLMLNGLFLKCDKVIQVALCKCLGQPVSLHVVRVGVLVNSVV